MHDLTLNRKECKGRVGPPIVAFGEGVDKAHGAALLCREIVATMA
jgi:hypothetical protein